MLEWARWRDGRPSWYANPGKMPFAVSLGFEWLCVNVGHEAGNTGMASHEAMLTRELKRVMRIED